MSQVVTLPGSCSRTTVISVPGIQGPPGPVQVYTGFAPPTAPEDPTKAAIFYPSGGGPLLLWDLSSGTWVGQFGPVSPSGFSDQVYTGMLPPPMPEDQSKAALFYPAGGGTLLQWDVDSAIWLDYSGAFGPAVGPPGFSLAHQIYTGAAPPASPEDPLGAALYYPNGGGTLYQWDITGGIWGDYSDPLGPSSGPPGLTSYQVYTGSIPPIAPGESTKAALYYPDGGGTLQQWDVIGGIWV